jgi:hypothetical protein
MKITKEQYASLKAAVQPALALIPTAEQYAARDPSIPRITVSKDTAMRHRWDAFWASKFPAGLLYAAGCNDSHIDTALKQIVRECK